MIALVSQEPSLYAGSIRFNILLGAAKPENEVTQEELEEACRKANILEFVQSLPEYVSPLPTFVHLQESSRSPCACTVALRLKSVGRVRSSLAVRSVSPKLPSLCSPLEAYTLLYPQNALQLHGRSCATRRSSFLTRPRRLWIPTRRKSFRQHSIRLRKEGLRSLLHIGFRRYRTLILCESHIPLSDDQLLICLQNRSDTS